MVHIAEHHRYKDKDYIPTCAWPDNAWVQWGGAGLVMLREAPYRTAFFEAFPSDNAGGFIRGEGATIAVAEANAFEKYQRQVACTHRWCRKDYANGGAICAHCGAFKTVFQPIYEMGKWRKPIGRLEMSWFDLEPEGKEGIRIKRKIELRHKLFGEETGPKKPDSMLEELMLRLS